MFPELRPYLEEAFEIAQPGAVHVITRYRDTKQNLRTHFKRIIRRAGLKLWPRLFQNLRASRETELAETYPLHVVCKWIGNTAKVAVDQYLQVTEDYFRRAAKSGAVETVTALQEPVQQPSAPSRTDSQKTEIPLDSEDLLLVGSRECESVQDWQMTPTGFEPVSRP